MRAKEVELRARLDGRAATLADDLDDGDEVLVDGRPVEPGQVIVLKQVRDEHDSRRRGMTASLGRRTAARLCRPIVFASATPNSPSTSAMRRTSRVMQASCAFPTTTAEVQACVQIAVRHGRPFVARGAGTGLAGGATPLDDAVVIVTTKMNRVLSVDPGQPTGVGRTRGAEPRPHPSSVGSRTALRPRSEQSAELFDRRQRRQQLRRTALPRRWRDHGAHPGTGSRAAGRGDRPVRRRGRRTRRATTCAARSSVARACAASPPRCACDSPRIRRRSARC